MFKKTLLLAGLVSGLALTGANAHASERWSVQVGVYGGPQVYAPPPPVYAAGPVLVARPPVLVAPPVVVVLPPYYYRGRWHRWGYGETGDWKRHHGWREHDGHRR